jgi:hypothetical protein
MSSRLGWTLLAILLGLALAGAFLVLVPATPPPLIYEQF